MPIELSLVDFRDPNRVRCAFTAGGSKQRPMHQNCTDIVHVCTYVPIHAQHNELYVRMRDSIKACRSIHACVCECFYKCVSLCVSVFVRLY